MTYNANTHYRSYKQELMQNVHGYIKINNKYITPINENAWHVARKIYCSLSDS